MTVTQLEASAIQPHPISEDSVQVPMNMLTSQTVYAERGTNIYLSLQFFF